MNRLPGIVLALVLIIYGNSANAVPDTLSLEGKLGLIRRSFNNQLTSNPTGARLELDKALALKGLGDHKPWLLQVWIDKAEWYKCRGWLDSAITQGYNNLKLSAEVKVDSLTAPANLQLGVAYQKKGLTDSALKYLQSGASIARMAGLKKLIIRSLYYLGAYYNSFDRDGDKKKLAFDYFSRCQAEATQLKDDFLIAYAHDGLGSYLTGAQDYDLALYNFKQSAEIYRRLNNRIFEARAYNNISLIYDYKEDASESIAYAQKAIEVFKELGSENDLMLSYLNLAATLGNQERFTESFEYYAKAQQLGIKLNSLDNLQTIYNNLSGLYAQKGDHKKALEYFEKYAALKDSLMNEEKLRYISELETKYEVQQKEYDRQLSVAEAALQKRRAYLWLSAACFLLITGATLLLYYRHKIKAARLLAEKNEQLYRKKINEIIKEQELKSINEIMEGQENERRRIAEDLHDRLGSMLATVKLHFNAVEQKIESLELKSMDQYQKANKLLDQVCDEVRKIAHNMESGVLVNFGLLHALTDLKEALEQSSSLKIQVHSFGIKQRLSSDMEISLYRIIQELLSNVLKHSGATEVNIDLNAGTDSLTLMVSDNGRGYDPGATSGSGMGLRNIGGRVARLQGKFYVDSGKKNGTTSIIEIPLHHDPGSDS